MKKNTTRLLLPFLLLILVPLLMADMGPKPSAEFEIIYEVNPVPELVDYALYECETSSCTDPRFLEALGPQRFECTQDSCTSMAYGYSDYLYITFDFADGTSLTSNIFTKEHFDAEYEIVVSDTSLIVTETGGTNQLGGISGLLLIMFGTYACIGIVILAVVIIVIVLIVRVIRKRAIRND
jgi:hypothetical protein